MTATYTPTLTDDQRIVLLAGLDAALLLGAVVGAAEHDFVEATRRALQVPPDAEPEPDEPGPSCTEMAVEVWKALTSEERMPIDCWRDWMIVVEDPWVPSDSFVIRGCADDGETSAEWTVSVTRTP